MFLLTLFGVWGLHGIRHLVQIPETKLASEISSPFLPGAVTGM
jgi:hypothetical protein